MSKIDEINSRYKFYKINKININLIVDSTKNFNHYDINKKMSEIIDANNYDIKYLLQKILKNRKNYYLYNQEFDKVIEEIKKEVYESDDVTSIIKSYFKLVITKLKKQRAQLNFNVNVLISYTSPTRRNHYERRINYSYDDLIILIPNFKNYQNNQTKKYDEKIETIHCIYCNKLINLNSKYCGFCGKKLIAKEKDTLFDNSINNNTEYNFLLINKEKSTTKETELSEIKLPASHKSSTDSISFNNLNKKCNNNIIIKNYELKDRNIKKEKVVIENDCILENINFNVEKLEKTIIVTTDDNEQIIEGYKDSIYTYKLENKHKVFQAYFKNKYLNKNINNYEIINVTLEKNEWDYPYSWGHYDIYFYCKCNNCGRTIKQQAIDFLIDSIECKCHNRNCDKNIVISFKEIKKDVDDTWEKLLIPYKVRAISSFTNLNKNDYFDLSLDSINPYYLILDNELKRIGFSKIKEFNAFRKFVVGQYLIYTNKDKYLTYSNVYYSFHHLKSKPLILAKLDNLYIKLDETQNFLKCNKISDIIFIYYSKSKNRADKEFFTLKVYHNKTLKLSVRKNGDFVNNKIIDGTYLVVPECCRIEANNQYAGLTRGFTYDLVNYKIIDNNGIIDDQINFYNFNIAIQINTSCSFISNSLKEALNNIKYINNEKFKRIYIQKNIDEVNIVLFNYLNSEFKLVKVENEFDDDKIDNYLAVIDRNNKDAINFVEHIILKSSSWYNNKNKYFHYRIYDHSIDSIAHFLITDNNLKDRIVNLLENSDLFIVKNDFRKRNIISKVKLLDDFQDFSGEYKKIANKLKNKYGVDDLELLLILLKKYGEEIVFGLQSTIFYNNKDEKYKSPEKYEDNEKKYNDMANNLKNSKINWKSEYKLFILIKAYFPDAIFQYKFKELEPQSLDIFIPSLKIAFEYQGQQHYEPIERFGGKEHFKIQLENDDKKRKICNKNNIILIEWGFEEKINKLELDKQLENYRNIVEKYYKFTNFDE